MQIICNLNYFKAILTISEQLQRGKVTRLDSNI